MKRRYCIAALCTLLAACSSSSQPESQTASNTQVLENFTLIDGTGAEPVANAALVVTDGRIVYAGPASGMTAPAGAQHTDLAGKYVMPGIINLHGHLGMTKELVQDPKNFTRENVEAQLKTYASYGVTSMISMGTDQPLIYDIRSEQRAGRPSMTRVFTAGRGFTGKGSYPTMVQGMAGVPYEVQTPADVEKDVNELADKKVDLVKIWVDDHLGRVPKISMDLCKSIIENAHKHGLKVAAHVFYLADAENLVAAGLDGLAHSVRDKPVSDKLIALMKEHGAWQQAATLTREESMFMYAKGTPMLEDAFFTRSISPQFLETLKTTYRDTASKDPDLAKYPGFYETAMHNLKRLADAGVHIGFGTDSGPPVRFSGYFEHRELELMVQSGLTPAQVIKAATGDAATYLGVSQDLGTLQQGRWADLIVLGQNPLADIRNTRSIETVWIAGNKAN